MEKHFKYTFQNDGGMISKVFYIVKNFTGKNISKLNFHLKE